MDQAPLQSPPLQQAHDKIRGYAFQCWLTVDAWLRLLGEDRLFVECAEDFAVFTSGAADIGQAKALATSISLRSSDAVEAINHLWEFQLQGFPGTIRYSLLTTAGIAVEKGDQFGGIAGIKLWRETAINRDQKNAEKLRHFLATDSSVGSKLGPKVAAYLKAVPTNEFLEKILIPLVWDTGSLDETDVRAVVEGKLAVMASKDFAVSPLHAANLADSLFAAVVTLASSKEKIALTRAALVQKMQVHLQPQAVAAIAARQHEVFSGMLAAGTGVQPQWMHTSALPPIQPANDFSPRADTITALKKKVGTNSFIVLTGSTGMGKTTLAQLYSTAEGGSWLQFRAKDDVTRALRGLQECMALVDQQIPTLGLIVDDLPWEKLDGATSTVLRGFAYVARRGGARIIFTNQRPPTAQELAAAGLRDALVTSAPPLSKAEIVDIAIRLGCPTKELAEAWAIFVLGQTLGHPQLVHAQLIGLSGRQWPKLSADELTATGKDVQDERARRQILLADLRPGESELLQRLSLFFGTFLRDQALNLSQQLNPITNAGASFERLRGPWIEPVTSDYYQLSPLLDKSLLEGTSPERVREINTAVVKAVTSTAPVQASDACNALFNAIEGDAADEASGIIRRLICAPNEHASTMRHLLHWTVWIKWDGSPIFPNSPAVDFLFHLLQFDVASELAP
ncbi:MAG: hypothetical protein ABIZ49_13285, partial [Opitutaceae bacterium]